MWNARCNGRHTRMTPILGAINFIDGNKNPHGSKLYVSKGISLGLGEWFD